MFKKTLATNSLQEHLEKQKILTQPHHRDANIEFCETFYM